MQMVLVYVGSEQMCSFGEPDLVLTYVDVRVLLRDDQICGNPNLQIKNELVNFSSRKKNSTLHKIIHPWTPLNH